MSLLCTIHCSSETPPDRLTNLSEPIIPNPLAIGNLAIGMKDGTIRLKEFHGTDCSIVSNCSLFGRFSVFSSVFQ